MSSVSLDVRADPDDTDAAEVWAQLTVDGVDHWVVVDTGAKRTLLFVDDEVQPDSETSGAFGSLRVSTRSYEQLVFGPLELRDGQIDIAMRHPGARSLVGLDVLGRACWRFDFGAQTMTALTDAGPLPHRFEVFDSGHISIQLIGAAGTAAALWDTGAGVTVVDATYRRHHDDEFTADGNSTGQDFTGTALRVPMYRWRKVLVGGAEFEDVRVAQLDLTPISTQLGRRVDAGCGYTLLRHGVWTIDFPNGSWLVTRS